MYSTTIIAYIAKLAKENKKQQMENDTIKRRNVELREVIHSLQAMLRYREDCDAESVASNDSGESVASNDYGESGYEVTSDHYLPVIHTSTDAQGREEN